MSHPTPDPLFEGNPIIDLAERAIRAFGITDQPTAARALRTWVHRPELTDREVAAVLSRFVPGDPRGRVLRMVRESLNLSLRAVARRAGLSHAHLSKVERGDPERPVTPEVVEAYARATRLPVADMIDQLVDELDNRDGSPASGPGARAELGELAELAGGVDQLKGMQAAGLPDRVIETVARRHGLLARVRFETAHGARAGAVVDGLRALGAVTPAAAARVLDACPHAPTGATRVAILDQLDRGGWSA